MKKNHKYKSKYIKNNTLYEMVYDKTKEDVHFVYLDNQLKPQYVDNIKDKNKTIYPILNNLVKNEVILFPSEVEMNINEKQLIEDIKKFVHKYLQVSRFFENIIPYYILLTWIYDKFPELPYLRVIADYGSGKSRFLKVVGSLCYKPMFTFGATTSAPIFRIIENFNGTLILDEADLHFSDTTVELIKILNSGYQKGIPVLRCAENKNYDIQSFDVYGPKIIATRKEFKDDALESRFIVEKMDGTLTRKDIPLNLPESFNQEATKLRNQLLAWRLQKHINFVYQYPDPIPGIEPRLNQIILPLLSIVDDPTVTKQLEDFIKEYNKHLKTKRGLSLYAVILEVIVSLITKGYKEITLKDISMAYKQMFTSDEVKELSPRSIGKIVKNDLKINTIRKRDGYILDNQSLSSNIERLIEKYDIPCEQVNIVNLPDGTSEIKIIKEKSEMDSTIPAPEIKVEDIPF